MLDTISNYMLTFNHLEWGDDLLTEQEKKYLETIRLRIHNNGELVRKLGHSLVNPSK